MVKKKEKRKKKQYFLALILFLPIFFTLQLASLLTVFGGIAAFPVKAIECGHQPYIVENFAGSAYYTKPGDPLYRGPDIFTQSKDYYCTEAEAVTAGNEARLWSDYCQTSRDTQPARCTYNGSGYDAIIPFFIILIVISGLLSYVASVQILKYQAMNSKKS